VLYLLVETVTGQFVGSVRRIVDQRSLAAAEYQRDLVEQRQSHCRCRRTPYPRCSPPDNSNRIASSALAAWRDWGGVYPIISDSLMVSLYRLFWRHSQLRFVTNGEPTRRFEELCCLIAIERDLENFSALVTELNQLDPTRRLPVISKQQPPNYILQIDGRDFAELRT